MSLGKLPLVAVLVACAAPVKRAPPVPVIELLARPWTDAEQSAFLADCKNRMQGEMMHDFIVNEFCRCRLEAISSLYTYAWWTDEKPQTVEEHHALVSIQEQCLQQVQVAAL